MSAPDAVVLFLKPPANKEEGSDKKEDFYRRFDFRSIPAIAAPREEASKAQKFLREHPEVSIVVIPEVIAQGEHDSRVYITQFIKDLRELNDDLMTVVLALQPYNTRDYYLANGADEVAGDPPDFRLTRALISLLTIEVPPG